jgi:excisionase family DNA binding protein
VGPNPTDHLVHEFATFGISGLRVLAVIFFGKHAANGMFGGRPMNTTITGHLLQATTSDLMTSPEAATYLCISKGTLRHWVSGRKIEFVKLGRLCDFAKLISIDSFSQKLHNKHSRG